MKNTKKPARGRKFDEGSVVKSLRPIDDGATGVVISMSKKKNGWQYTVFFDGAYKAVVRNEEELEEF
jgi:hypothetical protein